MRERRKREREMLRWIDRQMQKRAELGITVQRFFFFVLAYFAIL